MKKNRYFGVVEGFYRKPYTFSERCDLIRFLADCGLNYYMYAPKSDIFHRQCYDRQYPATRLKEFDIMCDLARKKGVFFNYALSPGKKPEIKSIIRKIIGLFKTGIRQFSLLYDDISVSIDRQTAENQSFTANALYETLRECDEESVLFFCPTQYRGFNKTDYIKTVGATLDKNIGVFWTGSKVVSPRITVRQVETVTRMLQRPPLIWDNLFANDYLPVKTLLRFPYKGRNAGIVGNTAGIMINPMNEYLESKPLIYTAAMFFNYPRRYRPAEAWKAAIRVFGLR